MVYPGGRGSVRFSKLVEGIQDFEKVRILRSRWQETGNEAKLGQLTGILPSLHLRDSPRRRRKAKALAAAKSFLDRQ